MWIGRRVDNSIYGAWTVRQADDADHPRQEEVADDDPELLVFLTPPPPIDLSDIDNLQKTLKAVGLLFNDYCNALVAGTHTTKTNADLKADFAAKWNSLQ